MKNKILMWSMFIFINLPLYATVYNINQSSGTISVSGNQYTDNMYNEWNINIGSNKLIKFVCDVDTEPYYDCISIYNVDNSGALTLLIELSEPYFGTIYTSIPNGKAKIIFSTDGSESYYSGYSGFSIQFSADPRYQINNGLKLTGELDVTGNAKIDGLASFLNKVSIGSQSYGAKFYVYNTQEYYGIRGYTHKNTSGLVYGIYSNTYNYSGHVYGIYSSVGGGGSAAKRWAGYFSGGDVEITNGKLKARDNMIIGSGEPLAKLHVNSGANNNYAAILATSNEGNNLVVSSHSTQPAYSKVFSLTHEYSNSDRNNGFINFYRGGSTDGGFLTFGTYGQERLRIDAYGNIGIGTLAPAHKLDVKGAIRATKVLIESVDKFADFVFEKDYELPSLSDVDSFIATNGHLPEIPSAEEVKENGINLVEMQVKLLQKIEELTLYTIKQQKEMLQQQKEIEMLKTELGKVKAELAVKPNE